MPDEFSKCLTDVDRRASDTLIGSDAGDSDGNVSDVTPRGHASVVSLLMLFCSATAPGPYPRQKLHAELLSMKGIGVDLLQMPLKSSFHGR